jgi:hypothetical protein
VARMEKRNACRILVGKHEGRRQLGRRRHRWEDCNEMDRRAIGQDSGGSRHGQVMGYCECGNEPSGSIEYGEFLH